MEHEHRSSFGSLEMINLNDVILSNDETMQRITANKGITIGKHLGSIEKFKSDAGLLEHILLELVINSRDAMPNGGRIVIETSSTNLPKFFTPHDPFYLHPDLVKDYDEAKLQHIEFILLSVSDNGCEMTEEIMARMYEPFFTTKKERTGLGLSTVRGIVNCLGGCMTASSEVGKGTKFDIYLPRL